MDLLQTDHSFRFLDLPSEIQQQIVDCLPVSDQLRLQRVSWTCHDLASRFIWHTNDFYLESRMQHISNNGPKFRLMHALQTLTCSDHDYAQYIRHLGLLGHPSNPMPSEQLRLFKIRYVAGSSAQQSLNINLLNVLRKAKSLEGFLLDAPFELSEAVWQNLAKKQSLLYLSVSLNGRQPYIPDHRALDLILDTNDSLPAAGSSYRYMESCSYLKQLSLLHLNELDHLDQIAACIRSSSSALEVLQLAFSEALFEKAKKPLTHATILAPGLPPPPPMEFDDDESYMSIDDAQVQTDPTVVQAENETIRRNKAEQESALARILSIESEKKDKIVEKALKKSVEETAASSSRLDESDADRIPDLVKKLIKGDKMNAEELTVMDKLQTQMEIFRSSKKAKTAKSVSKHAKAPKPKPKKYTPVVGASASQPKDLPWFLAPGGGPVVPPVQPVLDNLDTPFDMPLTTPYQVGDLPPPPWPIPGTNKKLTQLTKKSHKIPVAPPPAVASSTSASEMEPSTSSSSASMPLGNPSKESELYEDMNVDIEHPDIISGESGDDQESVDEDGDEVPSISSRSKGKGKARETHSSSPAYPAKRSLSQAHNEHPAEAEEVDPSPEDIMKDWLRQKDGLALRDFRVYLIPLKASVVGRALQLHSLVDLVLLSVGGQGPLWQMLDRAQDEAPLALKRIHTDDVSKAFLECVSRMQGLTKLALRRRSKKDKFNTTSKESATIEEIRKQAVQPHLNSLKILAIQNDQDASWCLTQELASLICARAFHLEEFAFQAGYTRYLDFLRNSATPQAIPKLKSIWLVSAGVDRPGSLFSTNPLPPHHPPPPPLSIGSGSIGPNGEPYDIHHNNFLNDGYRSCILTTKEWASGRKACGDKTLRYVAVHTSCYKVQEPKKSAKDHPTWLKEEYDILGEMEVPFEQWAVDNGPKAEEPSASFRKLHGSSPLDGGEIFSVTVMHAKLI